MSKDYISLGITRILILLLSLVTLPIIIRTLGESNYGVYVLVFGLVGVVSGLSNFGLGFTAMRKIPSSRTITERAKIFYPQFFMHTLFGVLLSLLVLILAKYSILGSYLVEKNIDPLLISIYFFVFPFYMQLDVLFKFSQRIFDLNVMHILLPLTFLMVVGLTLFYFPETQLNDILKAHIVSVLICIVIACPKAVKLLGFKISHYSLPGLKTDIKHGLPLVMLVILDQVINISDRYVIVYYLTYQHVAIYACAATITSMMLSIPRVITVVTQPLVSKLIDENLHEKASAEVSKTAFYWLAIALPATVGVFLLGEHIVAIYISPFMGANTGPVIWILFLGAVFSGLVIIYSVVLFAGYRTDLLFTISIVIALVNVALNLLLLFLLADILMAAVATVISYFIQFVLVYRFANNVIRLPFDFTEFAKVVMGSVIAGTGVFITMSNFVNDIGIITCGLLIIEFMFVYLVSLCLLKAAVTDFIFRRYNA